MDPNSILSLAMQGLALGLSAAATPGPFQAFMITHTLTWGGRKTIPVVFAPLFSDGPAILVILFLLNRLPDAFMRGVRALGGAFVLYMAYGLWKQIRSMVNQPPTQELEGDASEQKAYTTSQVAGYRNPLPRGVVMNLLSPGLYAYWSLVNGPILVSAWRSSLWHAVSFLASFYGTMIACLALMVLLISQARRLGLSVVMKLRWVSLVILGLFGLFLIAQGIINF